MASTSKGKTVPLICSDCQSRNYKTVRRKAPGKEKLRLKKFCSRCRGHRLHIEGR